MLGLGLDFLNLTGPGVGIDLGLTQNPAHGGGGLLAFVLHLTPWFVSI